MEVINGYTGGDNGVDSYGVDHSGFSTQDELQYQTLRANREQQLANDLQKQGITEENYPQYGTSFWGNSANNYGFGVRNIGQNVQNHPAMNMTPMTYLLHTQNAVSNMTNETAHNQNYISVHRKDVGWERNDWAERMSRSIRF